MNPVWSPGIQSRVLYTLPDFSLQTQDRKGRGGLKISGSQWPGPGTGCNPRRPRPEYSLGLAGCSLHSTLDWLSVYSPAPPRAVRFRVTAGSRAWL